MHDRGLYHAQSRSPRRVFRFHRGSHVGDDLIFQSHEPNSSAYLKSSLRFGRSCQKPDREGGPLWELALADARASDTASLTTMISPNTILQNRYRIVREL